MARKPHGSLPCKEPTMAIHGLGSEAWLLMRKTPGTTGSGLQMTADKSPIVEGLSARAMVRD